MTTLQRRYALALRRYLAARDEVLLAEAYELGRRAISSGWGVFDMARVHHESVEEVVRRDPAPDQTSGSIRAAGAFFLEAMSPFEAAHRGFRETNSRLHELIATLKERHDQLARTNEALEIEIGERERTEAALRESEEHLRALFYQSRVMQENLRHLSNQILHAQEEERKRISRELHDEVGQSLTAISVSLATLRNAGVNRPETVEAKVGDVQRLLVGTMESVHRFARELRPSMLDELGLLPALRSCLMAFSERTGLQIGFRASAAAECLNSDQKTVLFRITQESLTNVAKHARASRVDLSVRRLRQGICLEVADNGCSFEPSELQGRGPKTKRLGLLGMQERVRLIDGQFSIHPVPGRGTTIRVIVPLDREALARAGSESEPSEPKRKGKGRGRGKGSRAGAAKKPEDGTAVAGRAGGSGGARGENVVHGTRRMAGESARKTRTTQRSSHYGQQDSSIAGG